MAQKQLDVLHRNGIAGSVVNIVVSDLLQQSTKQEDPIRLSKRKLKLRPISSFSYRERIVHLLAVRPYRKTKLEMELNKDGSSKRYNQCWTKALGKVSNFNSRRNLYKLKDTCYKEVRESWPFYDDAMRGTVRRKLLKTQEGSFSPGSSRSGDISALLQGASGSKRKRSNSDDCVALVKKQQRIAHSLKSTSMQDVESVSSQSHHNVANSKVNNISPSSSNLTLAAPQPIAKVDPQLLSVAANRSVSAPRVVCKVSPQPAAPQVYPQPVSNVVLQPVTSSDSQFDPNAANKPVAYPLDDYITNEELSNMTSVYGPIKDNEERKRYKADFEAGAREYNLMYGPTKESLKAFTKLEGKLKESKPTEIEAVKHEIYVSYLKLKNDGEYMSQRAALFRLKKKLDHIRTMIEEYDQRMLQLQSS